MPDHPTPAAARTTSLAEPLAEPKPGGSGKPEATGGVRDTLGACRAIGGIGGLGRIGRIGRISGIGALGLVFIGAIGTVSAVGAVAWLGGTAPAAREQRSHPAISDQAMASSRGEPVVDVASWIDALARLGQEQAAEGYAGTALRLGERRLIDKVTSDAARSPRELETTGGRRATAGGFSPAASKPAAGSTGPRAPPAAPIGLASLQPLLDDATALFDYVLGDDRSYLWVVTRHGCQAFSLAGKQAIDAAAARLLELSTQTSGAAQLAWGQAAAALSNLVLQPAIAALHDRRRLIVVADGMLLTVPFGALPEPGSDGAPTRGALVRPVLLDAHEVSSAPSIVALETLHMRSLRHERQRQTPGRRPRRVTVIADPLYSAADPRLHDRGASAELPDSSFIRRHRFLAGYGKGRRPLKPPGRMVLQLNAPQRPPITHDSVAGAPLIPIAGERVVTLRGGQPQGWLTGNPLRTIRTKRPAAGPSQSLAVSHAQWLYRLMAGDSEPLRSIAVGSGQWLRRLVASRAEALRYLAAGHAPWLLGLAASRTEPFPRLAASQEEALTILDMSPDGGTVALGAAASRDFILQGGLRDARTIHFAAHSTINWLFPPQSGLVLSQFDAAGRPANGLLTAPDIAGLQLQADLVTLGSCSSARGALPAGAALASPSGAFLMAGARCVLASLWNVEDHSTAELMRRFYDGVLRQGLTAPEALRRAQAALRADPRWHAPYYWAGFVLDGDCSATGAGGVTAGGRPAGRRRATMNR